MLADHTPQRVVSLQPSATVILQSIGKLDRLVACTKYCADVCPEVSHQGCSIIADSWTANANEITAACPDLVIASVPYQEKAVIEILKSGTSFLGFAPHNLADIYKDIAAIAGIMGVPERGQTCNRRNASENRRTSRKPNQQTSALDPGFSREEWGKPLIVSQTWVAESDRNRPAANSSANSRFEHTTAEAGARSLNPEVFIAAWCGAGKSRPPVKNLFRERGWSNHEAFMCGARTIASTTNT